MKSSPFEYIVKSGDSVSLLWLQIKGNLKPNPHPFYFVLMGVEGRGFGLSFPAVFIFYTYFHYSVVFIHTIIKLVMT